MAHLLSAAPVGSHLSMGTMGIAAAKQIYFISQWSIVNPSSVAIPTEFRVRLNWAKSGGDDTWFEYAPQDGVRRDFFFENTGVESFTLHGASRSRRRVDILIPANKTTKLTMGMAIPGPAASARAQEFWSRHSFYDFNFLVAPHQIMGTTSFKRIGEHEFKQVARLDMRI